MVQMRSTGAPSPSTALDRATSCTSLSHTRPRRRTSSFAPISLYGFSGFFFGRTRLLPLESPRRRSASRLDTAPSTWILLLPRRNFMPLPSAPRGCPFVKTSMCSDPQWERMHAIRGLAACGGASRSKLGAGANLRFQLTLTDPLRRNRRLQFFNPRHIMKALQPSP